MAFPLTANDISLWLAVTAIILLMTSEFLAAPTTALGDIAIDRTRLRLVAIGVGIAFMATVVLRIVHPF